MNLRRATSGDLDFMVRVDLEDEGVTSGYRDGWQDADFAEHREQIGAFLSDLDKGCFVADSGAETSIGLVMWRIRNLKIESLAPEHLFSQIETALPPSGIFCEIFQLWVAPSFRRKGIGSILKKAVEAHAIERGVEMIYTHTEERNLYVLEFNKRLGYREVRRGRIWDDEVRVSLVKDLRLPGDA